MKQEMRSSVLMVCKIKLCEKSHPLNEQGVWSRSVIVAPISGHCTRCAVFPMPQIVSGV